VEIKITLFALVENLSFNSADNIFIQSHKSKTMQFIKTAGYRQHFCRTHFRSEP